jgi:integral membrane sensor domain MASE1
MREPTQAPSSALNRQPARLFVVVLVGYGLGSWLAFGLIDLTGLGAVFYIPSGITLAALVSTPRRLWWVVLAAAAVAEAGMDVAMADYHLFQVAGFVVANVAEPLVGASIIRRLFPRLDLARRGHVLAFLGGAVVAGPFVGAVVGASVDRAFGGDGYWATLGHWWIGDSLGVLLVGGALLVWRASPDHRPIRSVWGFVLIAGSVALSVAAFWLTGLPVGFVVVVGFVVAGVVFGVRAVAVVALIIAGTIAGSVIFERGVFFGFAAPTELVLVQIQLGVLVAAGFVVAAEASERDRAASAAVLLAARTATEHHILEQLQRLLLPEEEVAGDHVRAVGVYLPASEAEGLGGDWYDVIQLPDRRWVISVGDAVGHDVAAAAAMGQLRVAASVLSMEADSPGGVIEQLSTFAGQVRGATGSTYWIGFFDPAARTISYASAGHPPGFLMTEDSLIRLDGALGPPVGVITSDSRPSAVVGVPGAATLVLYTDGLIERRGEPIDAGLSRLETALGSRGAGHTTDAPSGVLEEMMGDVFYDDTVLLWARLWTAEAGAGSIAPPQGPSEPG